MCGSLLECDKSTLFNRARALSLSLSLSLSLFPSFVLRVSSLYAWVLSRVWQVNTLSSPCLSLWLALSLSRVCSLALSQHLIGECPLCMKASLLESLRVSSRVWQVNAQHPRLSWHVCVCVFVRVCVSISLSLYLCMYVCACVSVPLSACLCVSLSVCICIYLSLCLSVYVYMYVCVCGYQSMHVKTQISPWDHSFSILQKRAQFDRKCAVKVRHSLVWKLANIYKFENQSSRPSA